MGINKCLCGFEDHSRNWELPSKERDKLKIEDEFIHVTGNFFINQNSYEEERVSLLACPKCKTIKMTDEW